MRRFCPVSGQYPDIRYHKFVASAFDRTNLTSFTCFYISFGNLQETLKKMRDIDDKIIYALNTSIPTESFKGQLNAADMCKDLHGKLTEAHDNRCKLIKNCIAVTADKVKELKTQKDDANAYKNFKSEQRKVPSNRRT